MILFHGSNIEIDKIDLNTVIDVSVHMNKDLTHRG